MQASALEALRSRMARENSEAVTAAQQELRASVAWEAHQQQTALRRAEARQATLARECVKEAALLRRAERKQEATAEVLREGWRRSGWHVIVAPSAGHSGGWWPLTPP